MSRRFAAVLILLSGLSACAALTGLADYAIVDDVPADGGVDAPVTLEASVPTADVAVEAAPDGGELTIGGITLSPATVEFPRAACGVELSRTISLDSGDAAATVDVSMEASDVFSLAEAISGSIQLKLAPHQHTSFTVKAKPTRAGSASTDIVIKIADEAEHHVAVSLATVGGSLGLSTSTVDFGTIPEDTASPKQSVTFRNDSTEAVTVTGLSPAPQNFTLAVPFTVPAGKTLEREVQMTAGAGGGAISETVTPQADALCGDPPSLALKGQRVNVPTAVNPLTIDFGDVNCGASAPANKTILISNYTGVEKVFSGSLTTSSFAVAGASGVVPAGTATTPATATIIISLPPAALANPANLNDKLEVNVAGTKFTVAVHALVRGALLEASPTSLTLKRTTTAAGSGKVTLTNKGNVAACVKYARSNDTFASEETSNCNGGVYGGACSVTDDTDQVNANASTDWNVKFFKGSAETTTITANVVACNGSSAPVPLCGTAPKVTVSAP